MHSAVHNGSGDEPASKQGEANETLAVKMDTKACGLKIRLMALMSQKMRRGEAERRFRYFLACRQTFVGARNISFGIDATRLGQKNMFGGIVTNPAGFCAICPPQAQGSVRRFC